MKRCSPLVAVILLLALSSPSSCQTIYDGPAVDSPELRIQLVPKGADRFAIVLTDKVNGRQVRHEFAGEGANDPSPFLLAHSRYCDTSVILLTVEYPWRHDLPEFQRVLSTFAFRLSNFAFVDVAHGPLTDVALADETAYDPADLDMLPPIRVRCRAGQDGKPFEFFVQETK